MASSDKIKVTIISGRDIHAPEPLYCAFDWTADRYGTDPDHAKDGQIDWMEEFEIWLHPAMEKIIRFEVRAIGSNKPYGKVQIDLGLLKAGVSEAWYKLSRLDGELPFPGHLRIRLAKVVDQVIPPSAMSAVLPTLDNSVAESLEAEYVAGLTKEEREAFYDQKGLKPAFRQDQEESSDLEDVPMPSGKNIAVFWELKNLNPGLEDKKIHSAMAKNGNDLEKTMDYLQKKQHKAAREVQKHEFLDGGKLNAPPVVPQQPRNHTQEKKNIEFMMNAAAGEMMDVPLFEGIAGASDNTRRKALLIGCNYSRLDEKWQLQEGPLRDIRRVRNWLENVWGFANEDGRMMMMADDHPQEPCKPNKSNILRALEWLGRDASPGDSLFVYFSGHGGSGPVTGADESAFQGDRPFWHAIDGQKVDVAEIYEHFLIKLPEACRVTFLVDCPNFHLWQPWFFNPHDLTIRKSSHRYLLPADVQVFSSIGHPIVTHGGRFTNTFLSYTSGDHYQSSYYELLHNLNSALKTDVPDTLRRLNGTRMNYFTCSQRSDLNRPFDLNSWIPNCNRLIGPETLDLSPVTQAPQAEPPQEQPQFKLNIKVADQAPPTRPVAQATVPTTHNPGNYGIKPPSRKESRRTSAFREIKGIINEAKEERRASKAQR